MAIIIEEQGNGILFNGNLTDKQGWVLSPSSDQTKVVLTNRITGLSGSSDVTEVEVDGSTFADYDALVAALGSVLFKNGGGTGGSGVQSVTGDGVDNTDPENPTISYPTVSDIGAAAATHTHNASDINAGTLAAARIPNLSADKITSGTFADARIPALSMSKITGLPAALDAKVGSEQESGVGTLISNIIQVTQSEYDGLIPQAGTFYAIVG